MVLPRLLGCFRSLDLFRMLPKLDGVTGILSYSPGLDDAARALLEPLGLCWSPVGWLEPLGFDDAAGAC